MLTQEETFKVGQDEKHDISFKLDAWWGRFYVLVDGAKTSVNGQSIVSGPFTIEIGEQEKHTVSFQVMLPAFFGAFKRKEVQVLIDGKIFKTYN